MTALKIVAVLTLQIYETKARVSSIFLLLLIQFQGLPVVCSLLSVAPPVLLCNWAGNYTMLTRGKKKDDKSVLVLVCEVLWDERRCCIFSKFRSIFSCGSSHHNISTAEGIVLDGWPRNMQGELLKMPQLLEEMFSELWRLSLFKTRFLNDAVILFWIHFGWKGLRVFLHWTTFQTFGSYRLLGGIGLEWFFFPV